jgi:hypothetical protein
VSCSGSNKHSFSPCRDDAIAASVALCDLGAFKSSGSQLSSLQSYSALDVAWISECSVAVALKHQGGEGRVERNLYAFSGYATEVHLENDQVCQLFSEIDGCVAVGETTWTFIRDVPLPVKRVRSAPYYVTCNLLNDLEQRPQARIYFCNDLQSDNVW